MGNYLWNAFLTIAVLFGASFLVSKLFGNPDGFGVLGYSAFVLVGLVIFIAIFIPFSASRRK
jgi:hypothetical protein